MAFEQQFAYFFRYENFVVGSGIIKESFFVFVIC